MVIKSVPYPPVIETGGIVSGVKLGSEAFTEWVRRNVIKGIRGGRDLPALRQLAEIIVWAGARDGRKDFDRAAMV